jgi:hypothetical protein
LSEGDNIGLAWDADADKFWYRLNGTWLNSGNPGAGTNPSGSGRVDGLTTSPGWGTDNIAGTVAVRGLFSAAAWVHGAPVGFAELPE